MSDTTSVICPGQRNLFGQHDSPHYLRVVVTVYYNGGPSNTDVFYLHNYPLSPFNISTINRLEADILDRLRLYQGFLHVNRVVYISYQGIPMSDADLDSVGWHFIQGGTTDPMPEPAPAPTAAQEPTPTPEPTTVPAPIPAGTDPEPAPPPSPDPVPGVTSTFTTPEPRGRA